MPLKNYYQNIISNLNTSKFLRFFLYMLIFFQPFNRFNSFREIGFYGLLLFFILKIFKDKAVHIDFRDKTIVALSLLASWAVLVSILGPYSLDSLNAIRKNLLPQVLIFLVIIMEFKKLEELKTLFLIVVISFLIVTFVSIFENISSLINFNLDINLLQSKRTHRMFIGGYANNATFYLPFIAAWLTALNEAAWKKWIGLIALLLGLITVFTYNSRTALIAIPTALFIIFLLSKKYKLLIISSIVIILSISMVFSQKSDMFSKYKSLANFKTYISNEGLSNRFGVWQGAFHIIKERPFTGYGYGWKKMAWVIKEKGYSEFWKEKYPNIYSYYIKEAHASYGRTNPHNLALQIAFEIGLIGLVIFIWLWITIILKIFKVAVSKEESEMRDFMRYSIGILISYILINITNGFWQEAYGNMIFMFIASIFVIHKQYVSESKFHERIL